MPPKLFSFTLFRKNASATPLVSDTFKTTIRPGMVVLSEHREPKDPSESCKPFRLIHFRKNASANPLESHTFKTKDLKPFRFTHFQKSGGGSPHLAMVVIPSEPTIFAGHEGSQRSESREPQPANHKSPVTNAELLRLSHLTSTLTNFASASPLDSALTLKRASKSFTSNTYEKHTQGEGGRLKGFVIPLALSLAEGIGHSPRVERGASGGISLRLP